MIVSDAVERYLDSLGAGPDAVLAEMEEQARRERIPVVRPATGRLLGVLVAATAARSVLEIGSAIGVSTLHMARALPADGRVVSFEIDPLRQAAARAYLERAGVSGRVELRLEDARSGLAGLRGERFDLVFVDGVKAQYRDYLEGSLPLLRPGGVVAVDNALLDGRVAEGRGDDHWSDGQVQGMRAVNAWLLELPGFTGTLLPVGDGVLVAVGPLRAGASP